MSSRRAWTSPAALEIAASCGERDPVAAIRRHARDMLAHAGAVSAPIGLASMFGLAGVRKVRIEDTPLEGALRRTPTGLFDIVVREGRPQTRQRFSIAHELGHTLFYRHAPMAKALQIRRSEQAPAEEERLCNVAAEELLMPEWLVSRALQDAGEDVSAGIIALADAAAVSVEAALLRIADVVQESGVVELWVRDGGWQRRLARRTGRLRAPLDTYKVEAWGEKFVAEHADLPWTNVGWLYSAVARNRLLAHTFARCVRGRPNCVVVVHELVSTEPPASATGTLEGARRTRVRNALAARPADGCRNCGGEGWIAEIPNGGRLVGYKPCSCRYEQSGT